VVGGNRYFAGQAGAVGDPFLLELGHVVLARAEKARPGRGLTIDFDGRRLVLRPRSFHVILSSDLELLEGGQLVGYFTREGIFSGPATADVPANLPTHVTLFIIWLATMQWSWMAD
jgi:hypothetical protein